MTFYLFIRGSHIKLTQHFLHPKNIIFLSLKMTDISTYYGGSILALKGKSTIAFVSDLRLGKSNITISKNFPKIFRIDNLFIGYPQFQPDAQMLHKKIIKNHNLFVLNENRKMEPKEFCSMVSYILYSKRTSPYFTSPLVGGIGSDGECYIANMDQIGCISESDFVCAGTAEKNLMGFCENFGSLDGEELVKAAVSAFCGSMDRDALSGWGCEAWLVESKRVVKRRYEMRQD